VFWVLVRVIVWLLGLCAVKWRFASNLAGRHRSGE
jgi:hypothetical protein